MEISDENLLGRARAGSRPAWSDLFERHQARIYRFALQMSGSPSVADEVVQETFLDLIRGGLRFDPARGSLGSFLLGVARLKALRWSDRQGRERGGSLEALPSRSDLARDTETQARDAALRAAIASLPAQFREVVVLCELSELSYEEAAGVIGCPLGTVRSRLSRARQMLLERLLEKGIHGVY